MAAVLLQVVSIAFVHAHDEGHDLDMKKPETSHNNAGEFNPEDLPSYAGLGHHRTQIFAHVALMVFAWFFLLPIGTSKVD